MYLLEFLFETIINNAYRHYHILQLQIVNIICSLIHLQNKGNEIIIVVISWAF